MFTVAVVNLKGGVGKTTLATNLAAVAVVGGVRTLLVDLDTVGAYEWWHSRNREAASPLDALHLKRLLKPITFPQFAELADGYGAVFLDAPAKLPHIVERAAAVADLVLIPVEPSPYDLRATDETMDVLNKADKLRAEVGRGALRRLYVVSAAEVGTTLTAQLPGALEGAEVCRAFIHRRIAFKRTAMIGESVVTVDLDDGVSAGEVKALYRAITRRITNQ